MWNEIRIKNDTEKLLTELGTVDSVTKNVFDRSSYTLQATLPNGEQLKLIARTDGEELLLETSSLLGSCPFMAQLTSPDIQNEFEYRTELLSKALDLAIEGGESTAGYFTAALFEKLELEYANFSKYILKVINDYFMQLASFTLYNDPQTYRLSDADCDEIAASGFGRPVPRCEKIGRFIINAYGLNEDFLKLNTGSDSQQVISSLEMERNWDESTSKFAAWACQVREVKKKVSQVVSRRPGYEACKISAAELHTCFKELGMPPKVIVGENIRPRFPASLIAVGTSRFYLHPRWSALANHTNLSASTNQKPPGVFQRIKNFYKQHKKTIIGSVVVATLIAVTGGLAAAGLFPFALGAYAIAKVAAASVAGSVVTAGISKACSSVFSSTKPKAEGPALTQADMKGFVIDLNATLKTLKLLQPSLIKRIKTLFRKNAEAESWNFLSDAITYVSNAIKEIGGSTTNNVDRLLDISRDIMRTLDKYSYNKSAIHLKGKFQGFIESTLAPILYKDSKTLMAKKCSSLGCLFSDDLAIREEALRAFSKYTIGYKEHTIKTLRPEAELRGAFEASPIRMALQNQFKDELYTLSSTKIEGYIRFINLHEDDDIGTHVYSQIRSTLEELLLFPKHPDFDPILKHDLINKMPHIAYLFHKEHEANINKELHSSPSDILRCIEQDTVLWQKVWQNSPPESVHKMLAYAHDLLTQQTPNPTELKFVNRLLSCADVSKKVVACCEADDPVSPEIRELWFDPRLVIQPNLDRGKQRVYLYLNSFLDGHRKYQIFSTQPASLLEMLAYACHIRAKDDKSEEDEQENLWIEQLLLTPDLIAQISNHLQAEHDNDNDNDSVSLEIHTLWRSGLAQPPPRSSYSTPVNVPAARRSCVQKKFGTEENFFKPGRQAVEGADNHHCQEPHRDPRLPATVRD